MRALVTGATGFLGSHLAHQLVGRGDEVRVLVRSTSDTTRIDDLDVGRVVGDVTDPASIEAALAPGGRADIDVVFHTAACLEIGAADLGRMLAVNLDGTRNVLVAAAERDVLVVHTSSVAALGETGTEMVDESWWNPAEPVVGYEATKRRAHQLAREMAAGGARIRIGIPGGIYGPDDDSSMAQLIRTFVRYPTPVGYMPELIQPLVNVDDCADGLIRIAERATDGDEFILSSDAITFRRWFELIAQGAGRRPPVAYVPTSVVRRAARPAAAVARWTKRNPGVVRDMVALACRNQAFSGERARRELGWQPRDVAQGMREMADAVGPQSQRRRSRRGS